MASKNCIKTVGGDVGVGGASARGVAVAGMGVAGMGVTVGIGDWVGAEVGGTVGVEDGGIVVLSEGVGVAGMLVAVVAIEVGGVSSGISVYALFALQATQLKVSIKHTKLNSFKALVNLDMVYQVLLFTNVL